MGRLVVTAGILPALAGAATDDPPARLVEAGLGMARREGVGRFGLGMGLVLLLAGVARADTLNALVVGSAFADLYTTERGLRMPGVYEANPFAGSTPAARLTIRSLAVAVTIVGARELKKRGHHRGAKVARIAIVVLWSGAAVNNVLQTRRAKR